MSAEAESSHPPELTHEEAESDDGTETEESLGQELSTAVKPDRGPRVVRM